MRLAVDQRPALDGTHVAAFPIAVARFKGEARIDDKVERGLILKADLNHMVLADGEEFDKIYQFAFDLFKTIERPSAVSADCGLAAFGFGKAQGGRKSLSLRFFGIGMFAM